VRKYEEVRERIAKIIESTWSNRYGKFISSKEAANQVLSDPDLLIKAEDQDMSIGVTTKQLKNEGWVKTEEKPK
jgi:hypothetical protein